MYDKYGEDRVAQIITFGTMAAAIRDVGRAQICPMDGGYHSQTDPNGDRHDHR